MSVSPRHLLRVRQRGFGLIELMIGILLGSILLLGLAKVFSASRNTYQASEGLARVQENGRFALDFLQRDVRMAGHMGCVNDFAHLISPLPGQPEVNSHFLAVAERAAAPPTWTGAAFPERFDTAIEGFEATNSAPTNSLTLPAGAGWAPALPAQLSALANPPLGGSDVIVLRFLGSDSAPATTNIATNTVTAPAFAPQIAVNGMYALADCSTVSMFQATAVAPGGVITAGVGGIQKSGFLAQYEHYDGDPELRIYRAESVAYYIAQGANGPALFRLRFTTDPVPVLTPAYQPEELVEGIENMQILYGRNTTGNPTGAIDTYQTATTIDAAGPLSWRQVGAVRVALLSRSVDRGAVDANAANSPNSCGANCVAVLGVNVTPPVDAKVRETYLTTIALRNRLPLTAN